MYALNVHSCAVGGGREKFPGETLQRWEAPAELRKASQPEVQVGDITTSLHESTTESERPWLFSALTH